MGVRPAHLAPGQKLDPSLFQGVAGMGDDACQARLILFERGHWCAACRRQLSQMTEQRSEFAALPVDIAIVLHEPRSEAVLNACPFPTHADPDLEVAERFGLVHVDEYGMTTVRPSVLLVDADGVVLFSYVGDDSRDRPTVASLLLAIRSLLV